MCEKDQIEYFNAFRNTTRKPAVHLLKDINGLNRLFYVRECEFDDIKFYDLVLGDTFTSRSNLKRDFDNIDFKILMKKLNCESVTMYDVNASDDWSDWYIFEYYNNLCKVKEHVCNSSTKRAINKGKNTLAIKELKDQKEIFEFMFSNQNNDCEALVKKQAKFLSTQINKGKAICLAAIDKENTVKAILVAINCNDVLYMVLNKYKESSLNCRPNDFLYYNLICYSLQKGIDVIDWGNTSFDDYGLLRFKEKYSTETLKKYSAHLFCIERSVNNE